nr:unnamed protein product [Naegleria fowleri]
MYSPSTPQYLREQFSQQCHHPTDNDHPLLLLASHGNSKDEDKISFHSKPSHHSLNHHHFILNTNSPPPSRLKTPPRTATKSRLEMTPNVPFSSRIDHHQPHPPIYDNRRNTMMSAEMNLASTLTTMLLLSPPPDDDNASKPKKKNHHNNQDSFLTPVKRSLFEDFNQCMVPNCTPQTLHSSKKIQFNAPSESPLLSTMKREENQRKFSPEMMKFLFERTLIVVVAVLLFPVKMVSHLRNRMMTNRSEDVKVLEQEVVSQKETLHSFGGQNSTQESRMPDNHSLQKISSGNLETDQFHQQQRVEALELQVKTLSTQLEMVLHEKQQLEEQLTTLLSSLNHSDSHRHDKQDNLSNLSETTPATVVDDEKDCKEQSRGYEIMYIEDSQPITCNTNQHKNHEDENIQMLPTPTPNYSQTHFDFVFSFFIGPILLVLFSSWMIDFA